MRPEKLTNKLVKNFAIIVFLLIFILWIFQISNNSQKNIANGQEINNFDNKTTKISGIAQALDGDSIILDKKYEIRLVGIDAPEYQQKCYNSNNYEYFCGKMAANFLKKAINGQYVECFYKKKDFYDRFLGNCYLQEVNINNMLLKNGMAIVYSFQGNNNSLLKFEDEARTKKVGIWQGPFLEPRKYRKKYKNR